MCELVDQNMTRGMRQREITQLEEVKGQLACELKLTKVFRCSERAQAESQKYRKRNCVNFVSDHTEIKPHS
jgi:hypothetical protein